MKTFTYWETAPDASSVPPYILLGLVSMKRALGDDFIILNNDNIRDYVSKISIDKDWRFTHKSGHLSSALMSIVAKSDFLRMAVVAEHGGAWIDADTIVLRDYRPSLQRLLSDRLLWHSEQFFCARPGNTLLRAAADEMLAAEGLTWGDPGGIKAAVQARREEVDFIPVDFYDPGYRPAYGARSYEVMFREDLAPEDFLKNGAQSIQKMYNSAFVKFIPRDMPVVDFLGSDMLLAKIFRALDADRDRWVAEAARVHHTLCATALR